MKRIDARLGLLWLGLCAWVVVIAVFATPHLSAAPLPSADVVISQVYGGGGNSGATYKNDFIELFNRGTTTVTLNGWSVQYASSTGSSWSSNITPLSGTIAPGHYYLVQEAAGSGGTTLLPTPNVTGTINLSASAGKVALVKNTTAVSGTCPISPTVPSTIADFIGYGTSANCYEGTGTATGPSDNVKAALRKMNGCTDADDNAADFATGTASPRNSSSATSCSTVAEKLVITEVLYEGTMNDDGDEYVEIFNPLGYTVYLDNYKIGDEETSKAIPGGGGESMYQFPFNTPMTPGQIIIVARNADQFLARFGALPNFELVTTGTGLTDNSSVPNLDKYAAWATGSFKLANDGDEVLLLGPLNQIVDSVVWGNGDFAAVGLTGHATASKPQSLQRYSTQHTNNMTFDFLHSSPSTRALITEPVPSASNPGRAMSGGMLAYWGDMHSHSTVSDGSGPPRMAYATARGAGLHFFGLTDHEGSMTQEEWNEIGSAADAANADNTFVALRGFEFTSSDGHVNIFNTTNFVTRTNSCCNTLTKLYAWLGAQPNVVAQFNHPVWQAGGDFNNLSFNTTAVSPMMLVEVGNNAQNRYATFEAQYILALSRGWHVAPTNDSDNHGLDWGSDTTHRIGILAPSLTRANVLDALRARRVFATEDKNLAMAFQANGVWMGSTIRNQLDINWTVIVSDPDPEPIQLALFDNGTIVRSQSFPNSNVTWNVTLNGTPSHNYFVRAIQADGNTAYTAPIWTDATPLPTSIPPTAEPKENKKFLGASSVETARGTGVGISVDLEACVTVPPGVFSDRYIYLQDHTGGIRVYMASKTGNFPAMQLGDRVAVRGLTQGTTTEREIVVEDSSTIQLRGTCSPVTPKYLPTGSIDKTTEGLLVQTQGVIKSIDGYELILNDGSGEVLVYIDITTRIRLSRLTRGQTIRVIGVVSRVHSRPAILPRYDTDIASVTVPMPTRTNTLVRPIVSPTPTRTSSPRPAVNAIQNQTSTPSPMPRTFIRSTPEPVEASASMIDAHAAAFVGGTSSIVASFFFFGLAALMMKRK